jgi:hypothetical protein
MFHLFKRILLRCQHLDCMASSGMIIDELERVWPPGTCLEGLRRTTKSLSEDGPSPSRDSNRASPECESRSIPLLNAFALFYVTITLLTGVIK